MPFRSLDEDFSFSLYEKASALPVNDWDAISKKNTIFLEIEYLKIVETGEHTKLMSRYVIVYYKGQPCGIIYFQIVDFKAEVFGELLDQQVETIKSKRLNLFEKYIDSNKDEVLLRLFTCGNNLVSGEYGFLFDKKIDKEQAHTILLKIIDLVSKEEKLARTISAILLKDFRAPLKPKELFDDENYSDFFVEPNLIVEIPANVDSVSAYVGLFSKKYRNRAKSIFKNLEGVEVKYLNVDDIKLHEKQLYKLYEGIFEKAKFKLIKLPKNYFSSVKIIFEKDFTVKAFFYDNKIIAFASSFLMPDGSLEAHYIGFNYELNNQFNLYQNILYAMIDEAIKNKRNKVNLGRTAAEIKTTVGAKAENLICYIKPQNTISKLIQKPFISFLQPSEWIPRNPFKEEGVEKQ
ncbi:MAG: hypothetical protein Q8L81_09530 [Bacteroidota bacterium]|nr:hypothetical protein [Bacteroidota bacterium]